MPDLLPPPESLTIGFAHPAYGLQAEFISRHKGIATRLVRSSQELEAIVPDCDVVVGSGLWRNEFLAKAPKLRFVQSVSAGMNAFDVALFRERGVRLASAQGVNERAVAQHGMAMLLALMRQLHLARDAQHGKLWRPMLGDPAAREQEIGGRLIAIVGFGRIGQRLGRLAKAFECRVVGFRREAAPMPDAADEVLPIARLAEILPEADAVILACPLTPETERLIDGAKLALMKPSAVLINVARGAVVDEPALIAALQAGRIAAAGIDVTVEEPLPAASPLWTMENVIITPHSAGETQRYEANVVDLLEENLGRLWRGEAELKNGAA